MDRIKFSQMTRREMMLNTARVVAGLTLTTACRPHQPQRADVNIVIFLVDTLRTDHLGTYGYSKPTSPHIDALAKESVVFEQCNAPAPWTLPSVVSILTSTFPCEHEVLVDGQQVNMAIEPLAVKLKKLGYTTCSLYVNAYVSSMSGLDRGYDICKRFNYINGMMVEHWLRKSPPGPFYLYIHNVEPHNPWVAPDRLIQLFGNEPPRSKGVVLQLYKDYRRLTRASFHKEQGLDTTQSTVRQQEAIRRLNKFKDHIDVHYDAAVRLADERVGSVIEQLKHRKLWDKTLFILISDHGEEFGEHGGWQHDQSVYEELVNVPLIIHFPGGQYAGRRVRDVISLVDLMPTIFDYLNQVKLMTGLRGSSLMPRIRGGSPREPNQFVVPAMRINVKKYYRPFKETRGDKNVVIRQGHRKGIFNVEMDSMELYDLAQDPGEKVDLSSKHAKIADAMHNYAKDWVSACVADAMEATPGGLESLDEGTLQSLRSLGYID